MATDEWIFAQRELEKALVSLNFPEELGYELAKNLGSPKAIHRMTSYLRQTKPEKLEMVVDEMLAIMAEIEAWKEKKASVEANMNYNLFLRRSREDD